MLFIALLAYAAAPTNPFDVFAKSVDPVQLEALCVSNDLHLAPMTKRQTGVVVDEAGQQYALVIAETSGVDPGELAPFSTIDASLRDAQPESALCPARADALQRRTVFVGIARNTDVNAGKRKAYSVAGGSIASVKMATMQVDDDAQARRLAVELAEQQMGVHFAAFVAPDHRILVPAPWSDAFPLPKLKKAK